MKKRFTHEELNQLKLILTQSKGMYVDKLEDWKKSGMQKEYGPSVYEDYVNMCSSLLFTLEEIKKEMLEG